MGEIDREALELFLRQCDVLAVHHLALDGEDLVLLARWPTAHLSNDTFQFLVSGLATYLDRIELPLREGYLRD
jgi:hypothetical protein